MKYKNIFISITTLFFCLHSTLIHASPPVGSFSDLQKFELALTPKGNGNCDLENGGAFPGTRSARWKKRLGFALIGLVGVGGASAGVWYAANQIAGESGNEGDSTGQDGARAAEGTLSAVTEACLVRNSDAEVPSLDSPIEGHGYVMGRDGIDYNLSFLEGCTDSVFTDLMDKYCVDPANRSNPAKWESLELDPLKNDAHVSCAKSGCQYHSCDALTPAPAALRVVTENDPDYVPGFASLGSMVRVGNEIWSEVSDEPKLFTIAQQYCKDLGGRLPSHSEYQALAHVLGAPGSYDFNLIPEGSSRVWTSTLVPDSLGMLFYFYDGSQATFGVGSSHAHGGNEFAFRCVAPVI